MTQPLDEPLSADRIDALYRAHVSPMVFRRTRAVERPTAVFVGGGSVSDFVSGDVLSSRLDLQFGRNYRRATPMGAGTQ